MKIVRRGALPVGGESGLLDVRDRAVAGVRRAKRRAGSVAQEDVWPAFVERVLSFVDPARRAAAPDRRSTPRTGWPARCCRRCSTACRARGRPLLLRAGRQRSRTTSRTRCCPRTASSSSRKVKEEGADLGVAYDGDADRCFFVDDTGEFVPGDFTTALFAETILAKEPGGKVIYDVRASAGPCRTRSSAAGGVALDQPGRPRVHQAPHARGRTRSSAARCRRTTTSATSRRPTPASSRSCSMLELVSRRGSRCREILRALPRALLHHRRDQHAGRGRRRSSSRSWRSASRRRAAGSPTSTASRSTSTTGTSTSARRTPSRCCGSTSRRVSRGADGARSATRCSP